MEEWLSEPEHAHSLFSLVDSRVRVPLDAETRLPVEGGTTATVVALVNGRQLLIAHVGDSDAVLGGDSIDGGGVSAEKLTADHTPCSVTEYMRTRALGGAGAKLSFVYDCPTAELLHVFDTDGEVPAVSMDSAEKADLRGVGYKSVRAERPALIVGAPSKAGAPPPRLAVTRSLGDALLQTQGLTWKPEVTLLDLSEPVESLEPLILLVGSDGLWDLWQFDEAVEEVLASGHDLTTQRGVQEANDSLLALTQQKGEELLGHSTDDTTTVLISLLPLPRVEHAARDSPAANAARVPPRRAAESEEDEEEEEWA
ncbi:phosphatase 2C-like domain-containing protein [Pavlovales sp. CCMP2436]|nr:phosphatase 2C-like domain-containing protein [Pavlovales sp. CCMP2436]